jgi:hypothetical protein
VGGKGGRYVGLTTLPPSCAECHEVWESQPPGTLWACPGILWDCFTSTFTTTVDLTKHICQNNTKQKTHKIYLLLVDIKKFILEQTQRKISRSLLLSQNSREIILDLMKRASQNEYLITETRKCS